MRLLHAVVALMALCGCTQMRESASPDATPVLGDSARGHAYAEAACAQCHAVQPGEQASPDPAAPSFAALARTPGLTSIAINVWLQTPHENMPNFIIPQDRIDDLSAYILSFEHDASR